MEDPGNVYAVDELARFLRAPVLAVHAEPKKIRECIERVFSSDDAEGLGALESIVSAATSKGLDVALGVERAEVGEDAADSGDMDQPVINLIHSMLEEAYDA